MDLSYADAFAYFVTVAALTAAAVLVWRSKQTKAPPPPPPPPSKQRRWAERPPAPQPRAFLSQESSHGVSLWDVETRGFLPSRAPRVEPVRGPARTVLTHGPIASRRRRRSLAEEWRCRGDAAAAARIEGAGVAATPRPPGSSAEGVAPTPRGR